jgi:DNA-binding LytR/AlgR family response regulator
MSLCIGLGVALVTVNQFIIQQAISLIFKYGLGCMEAITNYCHMLFENNILTAVLIYLILSFLSYQFIKNKTAAPLPSQNAAEELPVFKSNITIKNNGIRTQVEISDILYIEARKNTILLFTMQKKHVLYQSLTSFEKELNPEYFIKIHRSFLVNKHFIASYASSANGNVLVKLNGGTELVMTRHYRSLHAI